MQLIGSGAILLEVEAAAELLQEVFGIRANVWSATGMNELRKEAMEAQRWNMLHPLDEPQVPWVTQQLRGTRGPGADDGARGP